MNSNIKNTKETFARLFVLAVQNKINFSSFTYLLERSKFISIVESGVYSDYLNKPLTEIFFDITGNKINEDTSYGIFNDAYWCGYSFFELFLRTHKPFSYIFLKLPFEKLIEVYSIYHEMDFSSLLAYFNEQEKKFTILRLLCKNKKVSLPELSSSTGINLATLSKYNSGDEFLYKASFQNIVIISNVLDAPINLFIEKLFLKE